MRAGHFSDSRGDYFCMSFCGFVGGWRLMNHNDLNATQQDQDLSQLKCQLSVRVAVRKTHNCSKRLDKTVNGILNWKFAC